MEPAHPTMLSRDEAVTRVLEQRESVLTDHATRTVSVDAIAGATLAESIVADRTVPERDFATMDGYAFDATADYPLLVLEQSGVFPEDDPPAIAAGEAVPIATGAPLPDGANAVLKREDATVSEGTLTGEPIEPGSYVYERGSNLRDGDALFEVGERLSPKDAILLGDLGFESVRVFDPFSTAVLATGTEIHEGRTADLDSSMLVGLVESWGHEASYEGSVPDDYDRVESTIERLATAHDLVLTTGGTSVGHKDYVIRALDSLGEVEFHRVSVRPGKPIAMATLATHDAVAFAIPGKPIGAHTISTLVLRPFCTGERILPSVEATLERTVGVGTSGFEYAIPVSLAPSEAGWRAMPLGHVDSPLSIYERTFDPSVLSSSTRASRADGFVLTETDRAAGESVSVIPYSALE